MIAAATAIGFWLAALAPATASAQESASAPATVEVALPCSSALIAEAHRGNNFGLGQFWVKVGNGRTRMLVRCELSALAGRAGDVVEARYRIRVQTDRFTGSGTTLSLHVADGSRDEWVEGAGLFDALSYCDRPEYRRAPSKGAGPGTTWNCPVDPDIRRNTTAASCPAAEKWVGGFPGHAPLASATAMMAREDGPTCAAALECAEVGGGADCWRKVDWTVTADVVAALGAGAPDVGWLLKRVAESGRGAFYAFSEEMAVCVMGMPELRPVLLVALVRRTADPPVVHDPLADGSRCALLDR